MLVQATIERVPNMDQLKPQPASHGADVRSARSPAAAHMDMGGRSVDQPGTVTSSPLLAPGMLNYFVYIYCTFEIVLKSFFD